VCQANWGTEGAQAAIGMEEKPPAYDNLNVVEDLIQPAENQDQQFNQNNEQYQQYNGQQQQQNNGQQQQPYYGQPQQQYNGPPQQQYNGPQQQYNGTQQQQYNGPQQQQYNGPQPRQRNEMDAKKQGRLRCMAITGIVTGVCGCWTVFGSLCGLAAIILGGIALGTYRDDDGGDCQHCSYSLACASLPLGLVSILGLVVFLLCGILGLAFFAVTTSYYH